MDDRRWGVALAVATKLFPDDEDTAAFFARVLYDSDIPTSPGRVDGVAFSGWTVEADGINLAMHLPWRPELHPRGGAGRFGTKPDVAPPNHPVLAEVQDAIHPDLHARINAKLAELAPEDHERLRVWPPPQGETAKRVLDGADSTQSEFGVHQEGKWVYGSKRAAHHQRILKHVVDRAGTSAWSHQPEVYFTAGTPGAGKSVMLASGKFGSAKARVKVDPDYLKTLLPEYQMMIHPDWTEEQAWAEIEKIMKGGWPTPISPDDTPPDGYAAAGVHEETYDIGQLITEFASQPNEHGEQAHLEIDGTGDSDPGEFRDRLQVMHDKGYKVNVLYAMADLATAFERAVGRAQTHGRWLALPFLSDTADKIRNVFLDDLLDTTFLNSVSMFDTNQTGTAKPMLLVEPGVGSLQERIRRAMVKDDAKLSDFYEGKNG